MRTPIPTGPIVGLCLAALLAGCVDVTPSSERDRLLVLTTDVSRAPLEAGIASFRGLSTGSPPAAQVVPADEMARRAIDDDRVALVLTIDPRVRDQLTRTGLVRDRVVMGLGTLAVASRAPVESLEALADDVSITVVVPGSSAGAIGLATREALVRHGVWTRMQGRLREVPTSTDALATADADAATAAIVLRAPAIGSGVPIRFEIDSGFHAPLDLEMLLLRETNPDARELFGHLSGQLVLDLFEGAGWPPAR